MSSTRNLLGLPAGIAIPQNSYPHLVILLICKSISLRSLVRHLASLGSHQTSHSQPFGWPVRICPQSLFSMRYAPSKICTCQTYVALENMLTFIFSKSPKGFKISAEQVAELATFLRDGTGCTQNEPGLDGSHPENMTKGQLYMTDGWSLVIQAPDSCPK